jgi:hypothetical protein
MNPMDSLAPLDPVDAVVAELVAGGRQVDAIKVVRGEKVFGLADLVADVGR